MCDGGLLLSPRGSASVGAVGPARAHDRAPLRWRRRRPAVVRVAPLVVWLLPALRSGAIGVAAARGRPTNVAVHLGGLVDGGTDAEPDGPLDDDDLVPGTLGGARKPLLSLQIGTLRGQADIVHNGLVGALYRSAKPTALTFSPLLGKPSRFYVSLTASSAVHWRGTPLVKVRSQNSAVLTASARVGRSVQPPTSRNGNVVPVAVDVRCHAAGTSKVRVELQAPTSKWLSPVFFLDRACREDVLRDLSVGTTPGGSEAVQNGIVKWPASGEGHLVEHTVSQLRLHLTMGEGGHALSFEPLVVRAFGEVLPDASFSKPRVQPVIPSSASAGVGATVALVHASSEFAAGGLAFGKPATLLLDFRCVRAGASLIELVLSPAPVRQPFAPLSIFFKKKCGGIHRPGFHVGTEPNLTDLVRDGVVVGRVTDVGGLGDASRFYFRMQKEPDEPTMKGDVEPAAVVHCTGAGEHEAGQAAVDAVVAHLKTGTEAAAGEVSSNAVHGLEIAYDCRRRGEAVCTLRLEFHLWRPVELTWRKRCGGTGGARPDVVVESDLERFASVFADGHASKSWSPLHPLVALLDEEEDVTFTVHRATTEAGVHGVTSRPVVLRELRVTSKQPDVVSVSLMDASDWASRVLSSPADRATIRASHVCKKAGEVDVTVNLALEQERPEWPTRPLHSAQEHLPAVKANALFEPVSFSYRKQCTGLPASVTFIAIAAWAAFCSVSAVCLGCTMKHHGQPWEEPGP